MLQQIMDIQVRKLVARLDELGISITNAAKDYIAREGYDPAYGARPLKRLIQKEIQDVLALKLLQGEFGEGQTVEVDIGDGGLVFSAVSAPSTVEA